MTPAICVVHGGQTGVDRGAHEAAIANDWRVAGYMPRDRRDELGQIPEAVARYLREHAEVSYAARTEANVRLAGAALIVVRDADDPRASPGTARTLDLAARRGLPRMIVDPTFDAARIARWIWSDLLVVVQPCLPLEPPVDPLPTRLLVAGPRESRWIDGRVETAALLRRVARAIAEIPQRKERDRTPPQQ